MRPAWHCGEPRKNQTAGQWEKEQERKARNTDSCISIHYLPEVCVGGESCGTRLFG